MSTSPAEPSVPAPEAAPRNSGNTLFDLLASEGFLTPTQVSYARRVHGKLSTRQPMLALVQQLGFISAEQIQAVVRKHGSLLRLGELLVELGLIQASELEAALSIQAAQSPRPRLGELLVERQYVSEPQLLEVISQQLGFPRLDLDDVALDRDLLKQVPRKWFQQYHFAPVRIEQGRALVAFADPLDRKDTDAAKRIFPNLIPAIAPRRSIERALTRAYGTAAVSTDENTIVGIVNGMIETAIAEDISDIHIEPQADRLRIRFRQDGVLVPHREFPLELASGITNRVKIMAGADIAERRRHQDGRILYENPSGSMDMRVSIYATVHGEKLVLRLLNRRRTLVALDELGIAPRMLARFREDALNVPSGIVIVTGPTGSGKTTTLYAGIAELNDIHTCIVTAEDPVEYVIDGISQCSINNKIQVSFEETLRHILRQDPDVIVIGEIRDRFSADTAIQAALTGHKVLTTFHTEDSIGGLLRLLNMEIEAFLISSTVVSIVAQRLIRKVCEACAEPYTASSTELARLSFAPADLSGAKLRRGRGCPACRHTGYKGRVIVFELLVLNEPVRDAILARRTSNEIRRISLETTGLVTLLEDGIYKAALGMTTLDEVIRDLPRTGKPRSVPQLMRLQGS